jgi:hypothetical protein
MNSPHDFLALKGFLVCIAKAETKAEIQLARERDIVQLFLFAYIAIVQV